MRAIVRDYVIRGTPLCFPYCEVRFSRKEHTITSFEELLRNVVDLWFRRADRLPECLPQWQGGLRGGTGDLHVGGACCILTPYYKKPRDVCTSSVMTRDSISILWRGGAVAVRAICHGRGGVVPADAAGGKV